MADLLDDYRGKRDFRKTPEPPPALAQPAGVLRFTVQKHAARRLHYDLRLECDGVLKSWAVPKGPSLDPKVRRLAVQTEDHPMDYRDFEGVIPAGEYGGGQVIVWDRGIYEPVDDQAQGEEAVRSGLAAGKLTFRLQGHKLRGEWALVRTKTDWLLLKHADDEAGPRDVAEEDASVLSARRIGEADRSLAEVLLTTSGARVGALAPDVRPMLAGEAAKPFADPAWWFEPKLDGIRLLIHVRAGEVKMCTRNGREATARFPALVRELASLPISGVFDGEVVGLDESGRPDFARLMERYMAQGSADHWDAGLPTRLFLFDVLELEGIDLRACPLEARRDALRRLPIGRDGLRLTDVFEDGEALFTHARELELEGIVAKRRGSPYLAGARSDDWRKVKAYHTETFWVGGSTVGMGARSRSLGALLLGEGEPPAPLRFVGNAGSGFDEARLRQIRSALTPLRTPDSPFDGPVEARGEIRFCRPRYQVEVRYHARTREGRLRHPSFRRWIDPEDPLPNMPKPQSPLPNPDILQAIQNAGSECTVELDGQAVKLSHLDRVYWPAHDDRPAITKRDLARYYLQIAPYLLPVLRDRPIAFVRFPDGLGGEHFFQKHWDRGRPDFIETVDIWSGQRGHATTYLMVQNTATLLWLAQMGALELHPWYSRVTPDEHGETGDFASSEDAIDASVLNRPDTLVIDLDPYMYSGKEAEGAEPEFNEAGWQQGVRVAKAVKGRLDALGLASWLKTSGKTGIHIYVPVGRQLPYEAVRSMAETLGRHVMADLPDDVTMEWSVKKRTGKVFFDHNQNVRGKTLCAAYSPRPVPGAPVSYPIRWEDLETIIPPDVHIGNVLERLAGRKDPWSELLTSRPNLAFLS